MQIEDIAGREQTAPDGPSPAPDGAQVLTVAHVSERELFARFAPLLSPGPEVAASPYEIVGPGDDCAVVAAPDGRFVISTDTQVQGQDFLLEWPSGVRSTGYDTGHKCATQNLADAAAMGAVPSSFVVSLTLPPQTPVRWVEDFARGLRGGMLACGVPECPVVGGDLGSGREISVTATVTGDLQGRDPVRRNGARPEDWVVLAGTVGRSAAGLDLLKSTVYSPGADAALDALAEHQLRPVSPVPLGAWLATSGATAMIDVSDGLLRDLTRLARASEVAVVLDREALDAMARPLATAGDLLGRDPLSWVLGGGEDHGLLSTVPPGTRLHDGVRRIGSVVVEPPGCAAEGEDFDPETSPEPTTDRVLIGPTAVGELPVDIRGRGWDHFERQDGFERNGRTPVVGDGCS